MNNFDTQAGRETPEPELSQAELDADEEDVFTAVRGLAGMVSDVEDLDAALASIATFAVTAIPGADGAGTTLLKINEGTPEVLSWAVTAPVIREIDHLQYDICREGPCLTAMQSQRSLVSGSLASDSRWPRFGARVARLGMRSALSVPLLINSSVVGALNIYAGEPDAFGEHAVRLAERFGAPAAAVVRNIQLLQAAHTRATQLQTALTSRAVIDQAIGIVRSRSGGSADEAFDRLRQISQSENVKLAVVAQRMVDEAVRRAHARQSSS